MKRKFIRKFIILHILLLAVITTRALAQAPRVPPQEPGPDGGLVHVVQYGDTLEGIMAAYAGYGITMDQLRQLNGWRYPPQFIFVNDLVIILPPGSIAPGSGVAAPSIITTDSENSAAAPLIQQTAAPASTASLTTLTAEQISAIQPIEVITPFLP